MDIKMVILIIVLISLILLVSIISFLIVTWDPMNGWSKPKMGERKAIILRVNEQSLHVMLINNDEEIQKDTKIWEIPFAKEGNIGFKKGQEIIFYFNGYILETLPGSVTRTTKN